MRLLRVAASSGSSSGCCAGFGKEAAAGFGAHEPFLEHGDGLLWVGIGESDSANEFGVAEIEAVFSSLLCKCVAPAFSSIRQGSTGYGPVDNFVTNI